jgi:hypothetical protein
MTKPRTGTLRAGVAAGAAGVTILVVAAAASANALYCGSGRGATPEAAIKKAIYDAKVSADGDGLFTCVMVGEPIVWTDQVNGWSFYRAGVNMACS